MKYQILLSATTEDLEEFVLERLKEGWSLQGGVAVSQSDFYSEDHNGNGRDNFSMRFAQAMTKDV